MRFETKIAVVVLGDLPIWQRSLMQFTEELKFLVLTMLPVFQADG